MLYNVPFRLVLLTNGIYQVEAIIRPDKNKEFEQKINSFDIIEAHISKFPSNNYLLLFNFQTLIGNLMEYVGNPVPFDGRPTNPNATNLITEINKNSFIKQKNNNQKIKTQTNNNLSKTDKKIIKVENVQNSSKKTKHSNAFLTTYEQNHEKDFKKLPAKLLDEKYLGDHELHDQNGMKNYNKGSQTSDILTDMTDEYCILCQRDREEILKETMHGEYKSAYRCFVSEIKIDNPFAGLFPANKKLDNYRESIWKFFKTKLIKPNDNFNELKIDENSFKTKTKNEGKLDKNLLDFSGNFKEFTFKKHKCDNIEFSIDGKNTFNEESKQKTKDNWQQTKQKFWKCESCESSKKLDREISSDKTVNNLKTNELKNQTLLGMNSKQQRQKEYFKFNKTKISKNVYLNICKTSVKDYPSFYVEESPTKKNNDDFPETINNSANSDSKKRQKKQQYVDQCQPNIYQSSNLQFQNQSEFNKSKTLEEKKLNSTEFNPLNSDFFLQQTTPEFQQNPTKSKTSILNLNSNRDDGCSEIFEIFNPINLSLNKKSKIMDSDIKTSDKDCSLNLCSTADRLLENSTNKKPTIDADILNLDLFDYLGITLPDFKSPQKDIGPIILNSKSLGETNKNSQNAFIVNFNKQNLLNQTAELLITNFVNLQVTENRIKIQAKVLFIGEIEIFKKNDGKNFSQFKVILFDGNLKIQGSFVEPNIHYHDELKEKQEYTFTDVEVQDSLEVDSICCPYRLVFGRNCLIQNQNDTTSTNTQLTIAEVLKLKTGSIINIMAMIEDPGTTKRIILENGCYNYRKTVRIFDNSGFSINLSILGNEESQINFKINQIIYFQQVILKKSQQKILEFCEESKFATEFVPNQRLNDLLDFEKTDKCKNWNKIAKQNLNSTQFVCIKSILKECNYSKTKNFNKKYFKLPATVCLGFDLGFYEGCKNEACDRIFYAENNILICDQCNTILEKPENKFFATVFVCDKSGSMKLTLNIGDISCQKLFGMNVGQLKMKTSLNLNYSPFRSILSRKFVFNIRTKKSTDPSEIKLSYHCLSVEDKDETFKTPENFNYTKNDNIMTSLSMKNQLKDQQLLNKNMHNISQNNKSQANYFDGNSLPQNFRKEQEVFTKNYVDQQGFDKSFFNKQGNYTKDIGQRFSNNTKKLKLELQTKFSFETLNLEKSVFNLKKQIKEKQTEQMNRSFKKPENDKNINEAKRIDTKYEDPTKNNKS